MKLKTTLEQWQTLQAVGSAGSFHAAAQQLKKSHTTLIYSVKKLERQLDIDLIIIEGRRAVLTEAAKVLLRRSGPMVEQARELEEISKSLAEGWESEIVISIDSLCDPRWVYPAIAEFMPISQGTSISIRETSLTSTRLAVQQQQVDIAIVTLPVTGFMAESFGLVKMVPVVSAEHRLAQQDTVVQQELINTPQIVSRDSGVDAGEMGQDAGWLRSKQRITVDNFEQVERAVSHSMGMAWLPEHRVKAATPQTFQILNIQGSAYFHVPPAFGTAKN